MSNKKLARLVGISYIIYIGLGYETFTYLSLKNEILTNKLFNKKKISLCL